jgi:HEXXH motif-containing protein
MAAQRYHGLIDSDLEALASGSFTSVLVSRLQSAVFSRNALLMEDLRRTVRATQDAELSDVVESAIRVLADVQSYSPDVVKKLLTSPHFGFWVADVLIRLKSKSTSDRSRVVTSRELGHIASFAAAAGLLASHHFQMLVPVHAGAVVIPLLGRFSVSAAVDWAEVHLDEEGMHVTPRDHANGRSLVTRNPLNDRSAWTETVRLTSSFGGLSLDLALEDTDPFLSRLSSMSTAVAEEDRDEWGARLNQAWQILVQRHGEAAGAMAESLSTLVPLRAPEDGVGVSAASGWAWGAIALSLPSDPLAFAETMVHEFRHLALGAAEDISALIAGRDDGLYYSPWRDDPRPLSGLLHGCYAFCGVAAFWQRECHAGTASQRRRAELAFALRRREVHQVAEVLADGTSLTDKGKVIVGVLRAQAESWCLDHVSEKAASRSCEIVALHQIRWRIANVVPDQEVIEWLARTWLSGRVNKPDHSELRSAVMASSNQRLYDGSRLLERALIDPDAVPQLWPRLTVGDRHLLQGDDRTACDAYLDQLHQAWDPNAWIGLVLTWRRMALVDVGCSSQEHIEVVVAIAERVRAITGQFPSSEALLAWTMIL